jgi:hypothetical protein
VYRRSIRLRSCAHLLRDTLDEIAVSPEFCVGFRSLIDAQFESGRSSSAYKPAHQDSTFSDRADGRKRVLRLQAEHEVGVPQPFDVLPELRVDNVEPRSSSPWGDRVGDPVAVPEHVLPDGLDQLADGRI